MGSSFLFLFPAELILWTCGSGRGEEPSGENVLRLIQIRLTTPSFEKIRSICQALTLSDALGVWNGDANSEKRTPEQSPSISVRQPSRARVRVTCRWCWRSIISDAPRCPHCSQIDGGLMRGAIHEPDNALPSRAILPKNVRLTVPVKVAGTSDAPRCRHESQTHTGRTRRAVHEPNNALAS